MGRIVIAAFRPKPGREAELMSVIADRLPLLRRLGLATERDNVTMRSADGVVIDVSEWTDEESIARAHETPEVHDLWRRFEECSEYVKLDSLPEIHEEFATFDAL